MSCDLIKILVINQKRLWYISIKFFLNTDDVILKLCTSLCQKANVLWSTVRARYESITSSRYSKYGNVVLTIMRLKCIWVHCRGTTAD